MEDVKKYILSLAEVGLYKARVEEDGKELIFADNKFEERTLPGKAGTFDETEELSVIDLEKEKQLARETKNREKEVLQKVEIEEEPKSFRVSPTKKWFRAALFAIPVIAAVVIFLLTNPPGKEKIDLDPQKTDPGAQVEKVDKDTPAGTETGLTDKQSGEISEGNITGEKSGETQGEESGDNQAADSQGEKTGDTLTGETTGPEVKTDIVDNRTPGSKQEGIDIKKDVPEVKKQDKQPVKTPADPGTKTPTIQTVKIVRLPVSMIRDYNNELNKLVIPFIPVKISVTGYLNVQISIDDSGNARAKILSSEGLNVSPEERRENVINLIIKKISSLKLTPPKDKLGNPVRVSWFNIDYQAGKLRTKLILKKR